MRILSVVACLFIFCGLTFAEDKKVEVEKVEIKIKITPKVGVPIPKVRPLPGKYYWQHPQYGWGYWYYPTPTIEAPANFYLDQYGRVVPNGYAYDPDGNLVPLVVVNAPAPYYVYPYRYHNGRWYWRK